MEEKIKHENCIEVLNDYLKQFQAAERSLRKLPASLSRIERTELTYYQEMIRNIRMIRDYIDIKDEPVDWQRWG
tara:strand:- start:336 stop:557 length:222 start_codon:yes stop_codon:yes gene_type:complete